MKMAYNGSELKFGEKAYKTEEKKSETLVCVFNSEQSKRPYKTGILVSNLLKILSTYVY